MNKYWKREQVSVQEAMDMAQKLWGLCDNDESEHSRYWEQGGNASMTLKNYPEVSVVVYFSPFLHRSGVSIERRGCKHAESMTYSPRMTLLEIDSGWFSEYGAWRYDPSCLDSMDDIQRECVSALEKYKRGRNIW